MDSKKLQKIKSGTIERGLSLFKMAVNTGAQAVGHTIQKTLSSQEKKEDLRKSFLISQAQYLTKGLGELKGSLMKAGQMLSMYGEHFFPPEVNLILKQLQSHSPPLTWSALEPLLKNYLSEELLGELIIEEDSLAAASMGQVHRARIKATGEWIVLKIQYPDVDKAIDNDLSLLQKILRMTDFFPTDFNFEPIFSELKTMLTQETNYELEAILTEDFFEKLKGDPRFVIPRVIRKYSNKKVLAMTFEKGIRVDDPLVQSLPIERRNKLAFNFLDLYFKEVFIWKIVQTDPHLGNYKIRVNPDGNDQLVLFDFGATRKYDDRFILPYHKMIKACYEKTPEVFFEATHQLKFTEENDSRELLNLFQEFCFETVEPFEDLDYDWKNTNLPERLTEKGLKMVRNFKWRTPPSELLFLDRKTAGVFIFLSSLKVRLNSSALFKSYLKKV